MSVTTYKVDVNSALQENPKDSPSTTSVKGSIDKDSIKEVVNVKQSFICNNRAKMRQTFYPNTVCASPTECTSKNIRESLHRQKNALSVHHHTP